MRCPHTQHITELSPACTHEGVMAVFPFCRFRLRIGHGVASLPWEQGQGTGMDRPFGSRVQRHRHGKRKANTLHVWREIHDAATEGAMAYSFCGKTKDPGWDASENTWCRCNQRSRGTVLSHSATGRPAKGTGTVRAEAGHCMDRPA